MQKNRFFCCCCENFLQKLIYNFNLFQFFSTKNMEIFTRRDIIANWYGVERASTDTWRHWRFIMRSFDN